MHRQWVRVVDQPAPMFGRQARGLQFETIQCREVEDVGGCEPDNAAAVAARRVRVLSVSAKLLKLRIDAERCPSGLRSTLGKRV